MRTTGYANVYVQSTLDEEKWLEHNDAGYPFRVRQVTYTGGDSCGVRGFLIKVDGSPGYNERSRRMKLDELPLAGLADELRSNYERVLEAALAEQKKLIAS